LREAVLLSRQARLAFGPVPSEDHSQAGLTPNSEAMIRTYTIRHLKPDELAGDRRESLFKRDQRFYRHSTGGCLGG
jgi:hypothetical protein